MPPSVSHFLKPSGLSRLPAWKNPQMTPQRALRSPPSIGSKPPCVRGASVDPSNPCTAWSLPPLSPPSAIESSTVYFVVRRAVLARIHYVDAVELIVDSKSLSMYSDAVAVSMTSGTPMPRNLDSSATRCRLCEAIPSNAFGRRS
jgi:hypothetical protein